MTILNDRRDNFVKKFAHDEELRFRATARRNKLLGLWAAERLGKSGQDAEAYAKSVVLADLQEVGDADVIGKVSADLNAAGMQNADDEVRRMLEQLMTKATAEIRATT